MLIPIFIAVAVGLVIYRIFATIFKPGLREIPGPWAAKVTDAWRVWYSRKGFASIKARELQKKYGDVVRVAPNVVLLSQKGMYERIFGVKSDYVKADSVRVWQHISNGKAVVGIATAQDKKVHSELKRPVAGIYSNTNVLYFELKVTETIRYFIERLNDEFIGTGKPCDIDNWVQYFAFDVVGQFTLSRRLGFLEQGRDVSGMLKDLQDEFNYRGVVQNMPIIDRRIRKNPIYRRFFTPTTKFMAHAGTLLKQRRAEEKHSGQDDFMDRFLQAQKTHPDIVSEPILTGYVSTNFVAGSDTTGVVMRAILYYVLRTPGVLEKLRAELDANVTEYPVSYKVSQNMPFLDAVIREAMRMHPIANIVFERVVPEGGLSLPNGQKLPAGTVVGMTPWTLNWDESIWGEDTESFKPDRWLQKQDESDEAFKERVAYMKRNDFSFSYGPRVCMGKHIALLEVYKVMPTMFGLLDMKFVSPELDWHVEGPFFTRQYGMDMTISWRHGVKPRIFVS